MPKEGGLSALFSGTISSIFFKQMFLVCMFDLSFGARGIFHQPLGTCSCGNLGDIISSLPREELQGSMRFDFRDVSIHSKVFFYFFGLCSL